MADRGRLYSTQMHRLIIVTIVGTLAGAACGADDMPMVADAATDTAGTDAATELIFETQVTDLLTDLAVFDVAVTDVASGTTTASAPNGRAILSLEPMNTRVTLELNPLLSNTTTVDVNALAMHNIANQPLVSFMTSADDLDMIYPGIGVARNAGDTQLLIQIRGSDFRFAPVVVAVSGSASFVRDQAGDFIAGDQPIADPLVLIPNVPGASASIDIPSNCLGPQTVGLDPGNVASAFFVCP